MRYIQTPILLWAIIGEVYSTQAPLQMHTLRQSDHAWELNTNASCQASNSTSHLVFNTVSSLLQHWPNTRYRNGHTLVPGIVPQGTLLYHGTTKTVPPVELDWVATDPEHSYFFCQGLEDAGCWHLTLVTTRPLNVLYFDGTSAAKMEGGPMDSQDVLLWAEPKSNPLEWELPRLKRLCKWGANYGLDGYVRMEVDFEIMLCNFTAGVKTVSFLNLVAQQPPWVNSTSAASFDSLPSLWTTSIESGLWHSNYPGETRFQLDLTRLVSFYDTSLAPSLISHRHGKDRLLHRVGGLDRVDIAAIRQRLHEVLIHKTPKSNSGLDWATLLNLLIKRYAGRLEMVQHLLNAALMNVSQNSAEHALGIQHYLRTILNPYILHSLIPQAPHDQIDISWAIPSYKHCATTHTAHIASDQHLLSRMTTSEHLIHQSVLDTNKEICRVIVGMWAGGVMNGLDPILQPLSTRVDRRRISGLLQEWKNEVDSLMNWLDWSVWLKCRPACGFEEMCYLPTWPFFAPSKPPPQKASSFAPGEPKWPNKEKESAWLDPKPKCIRRVQPFDL